jgi:hypothetical protein
MPSNTAADRPKDTVLLIANIHSSATVMTVEDTTVRRVTTVVSGSTTKLVQAQTARISA